MKVIKKEIEITQESLIEKGFKKQFEGHPQGFVNLHFNEEYSFSYGISKVLNLHKKQFGWVMSFPHIKYISQFEELYFLLTGTNIK